MRDLARLPRPQRNLTPVQRARPVLAPRRVARTDIAIPADIGLEGLRPSSAWTGFQPNPYLDQSRVLTPEGGILITYKDFDLRFRHTLWMILAWSTGTGLEGWYLIRGAPLQNPWIIAACLLAAAIVNLLIVSKPVEIYRSIEIRPDCMIVDGTDVFWLCCMEAGRLEFQPDQQGNQVLCGIYGTRFVEYLTVRRFDELDRTPEVFAAHLCEAMTQLWDRPG